MFNKTTQDIAVCINKKYNIEIQRIIDRNVKVVAGFTMIYSRGDDVYVTFKTKMNANQISELIKDKLDNSDTTIVGNLVFVKELA